MASSKAIPTTCPRLTPVVTRPAPACGLRTSGVRAAAARPALLVEGGQRASRPGVGIPTVACRAAGAETTSAKDSSEMFLDEAGLVAELELPFPEEELFAKTKEFLRVSVKDTASLGELMSDDFRFVAPVVGPLGKKEFLTALSGFDLAEALPDLNPRYHHFRLDPFEAGRVWFTSTAVGTHTGTLAGSIPATGTVVNCTPQSCSVIIDKEGLVSKYTIGYPMDRELGNTGGLGGIFGIFYAVGSPLPFPEANPWRKSKRYAFFQWLGSVMSSPKE